MAITQVVLGDSIIKAEFAEAFIAALSERGVTVCALDHMSDATVAVSLEEHELLAFPSAVKVLIGNSTSLDSVVLLSDPQAFFTWLREQARLDFQ